MRRGEASRTAVWVSLWRGLGGLDRPVASSDPIARRLLPPPYRAILRAAERAPRVAGLALRGLGVASGGITRHLPLRTRAIDEAIAAGVAAGAKQLVLLGAGLDARAYRLALLDGVTVFEVDHPDTQAAKRRAAEGLTPTAACLVYVAVDFARDDLGQALERAGHDATTPTVFVWEGVTMYLPPAAIEETLAIVASRAAPDSRLLVTYYDEEAMLAERVTHPFFGLIGEPLRARFSPERLAERLAAHGFRVESDEGDAEWGTRYLGRAGFGRVSERLACARRVGPASAT